MALVAHRRSVMTLFSSPGCIYCHQVRLVLAEKDVTVDISDIDFAKQGAGSFEPDSYYSIPTLVDRDLVLYNVQIISEYLDERFPHPPLLPADPVSRAAARLALYRVDQDWYRPLQDALSASPSTVARRRRVLHESLVSSASIFALKPFFLSEEFSLVDCAILPLLWRLPRIGIRLESLPDAIVDYSKRLFSRPSFKQSLRESEHEMNR